MANVLVIGDVHCPGMKSGYVEFLKEISEWYSCDEFVLIGDCVDWVSLSYHEKPVNLKDSSDEIKKARKQIHSIKKAFPKAHWLLGNHDVLPGRQCVTAGIPGELLQSPEQFWEVDWKVHPRYTKLGIDGVLYSHGDSGRGGQDAALAQAKDNFRSTVIGHFHNQGGVKWWANPEFRIFGMSVGCGIDAKRLQFEYGRKFTHKPILGCGVVLGGKNAYFEPWLLKTR